MSFIHILILAFIQGITEFIPVSSSGHLVLVPLLFDWHFESKVLDIAVHIGTLGAVIGYFHRDILKMIEGFFNLFKGKKSEEGTLALFLCVATLPVVITGTLVSLFFGNMAKTPLLIAINSIVFAVLLYKADQRREEFKKPLALKDALIVGLFQSFAILPGASRLGTALTGLRFLNYSRLNSIRVGFLLSIPSITAAATFTGIKLYKEGTLLLTPEIGAAIGLSFIFGLLTIHAMIKIIEKISFTPFVVYRILLGTLILGYLFL